MAAILISIYGYESQTRFAAGAHITFPLDGSHVDRNTIAEGKATGARYGHTVWLLIEGADNRYYPQAHVAPPNSPWKKNVFFGSKDAVGWVFTLLAVECDKSASERFDHYLTSQTDSFHQDAPINPLEVSSQIKVLEKVVVIRS